jgi:Arc/MetJ-type ribon-helix-helix transcriptional regulator
MENISLKLESSIARQIEEKMNKFHYSTKTEFIRDAIRTKLFELDEAGRRAKAFDSLAKAKGTFKEHSISSDFSKERHKAGEEYLSKLEKSFNQK